ncbi:MAG: tetratricopeptide repeat protein [Sedimentisphaerales bacterium]|nr:tetratricopeptide repeat protein [Sedimentisphaerales bacterium]
MILSAEIVILILTALAYHSVVHNKFISLDDPEYITSNTQVQNGLTQKGVVWAFTTTRACNWHPLTWLSHMTDCQLFGLWPVGHHLMGLLLHLVNVILLFLVLNQMTGNDWCSVFVAGLFALHPLHAESVAWAAERKDVLSTLFGFLSILFYIRYVRFARFRWYIPALISFVFSLMAKPMLVTLPLLLIILHFWPLSRFQLDGGRGSFAKRLLTASKDKIAFFILAAMSCVITMFAQQGGGAVKGLYMLPLKYRLGNTSISYISYIVKAFLPIRLAVFYPHPGDSISWIKVAASCLLLLIITVCVIAQAKRRPWFLAGWLWYIISLIPVIGFVQVGAQAMADRYTYVPVIGLFIIVAWTVPELLCRWQYRTGVLAVSAAAVILALALITARQVTYWRDSSTLFEHAINVTDNNYFANFHLAQILSDKGQTKKASEHYSKTVKIRPGWPEAHHNLAAELFKLGQIQGAVYHYKKAGRLNPDRAQTFNNLGIALEVQKRYGQAAECYIQATKLSPNYVKAHYNLAHVLNLQGRTEQAIVQYRKVLQMQPNHRIARQELQMLLNRQEE